MEQMLLLSPKGLVRVGFSLSPQMTTHPPHTPLISWKNSVLLKIAHARPRLLSLLPQPPEYYHYKLAALSLTLKSFRL